MTGSGLILTFFAFPVSLGLIRFHEEPPYSIFAFLMMFILIWSIVLQAHIFRHALGLSFNAGFVFSVIYNLISFVMIGTLLQLQGTT